MESKRDLWLRLRNYEFEHLAPPHLLDRVQAAFGGPGASTRAFADKLARKLGWSTSFSLRGIDEYRKFVYLGLIADFPVTPPKVIDRVWHEHLLFSRGYREFCASVLRREFDHHPELVPLDEQTAAFQAQYEATLDLYRTEFNREPPAEFWGTPKFAGRPQPAVSRRPLRRRDDGSVMVDDSTPLYAYFGDSGGDGGHGQASMPEFGGGSSGGAGGGGSWPDSTSHGGHPDSAGGGHDGGGHGDSGGGGDGGSGDGGSGCSSGCGGGCGSS